MADYMGNSKPETYPLWLGWIQRLSRGFDLEKRGFKFANGVFVAPILSAVENSFIKVFRIYLLKWDSTRAATGDQEIIRPFDFQLKAIFDIASSVDNNSYVSIGIFMDPERPMAFEKLCAIYK